MTSVPADSNFNVVLSDTSLYQQLANMGPGEMRIVLLGKTGNGKSATGNSILGEKHFESKFSSRSLTESCSRGEGEVDGHAVVVVDTPGLFDTRFDTSQTTKDIGQCIQLACPGPHVFMVVIRLGRFTDEEQQTMQKIQEIFGQAADKYSMVLFTHADQLEGSFEEFLNDSPEIQEVVNRCNGEYQVFNNKSHDRSQVTQLLQKIHRIVAKNGGSHYTNKMFQDAERAVEMEKRRIKEENEEKIRREREKIAEEIKRQNLIRMQQIQAEQESRRRAEALERRMMQERMERELREERERMEEEQRRERLRAEQEMQRVMRELEEKRAREIQEEKERLTREAEEQRRRAQQRQKDDCIIL